MLSSSEPTEDKLTHTEEEFTTYAAGQAILICSCLHTTSGCKEYADAILEAYPLLDFAHIDPTESRYITQPTTKNQSWQALIITGCKLYSSTSTLNQLLPQDRLCTPSVVYFALPPRFSFDHLCSRDGDQYDVHSEALDKKLVDLKFHCYFWKYHTPTVFLKADQLNTTRFIQDRLPITNNELTPAQKEEISLALQESKRDETNIEPTNDYSSEHIQERIYQYLTFLESKLKKMSVNELCAFSLDKVPLISITQYYKRFEEYAFKSQFKLGVYIIGLLKTFENRSDHLKLNPFNAHSILAMCFTFVMKNILTDIYYNNAYVTKVAGISLKNFNAFEEAFLDIYLADNLHTLLTTESYFTLAKELIESPIDTLSSTTTCYDIRQNVEFSIDRSSSSPQPHSAIPQREEENDIRAKRVRR